VDIPHSQSRYKGDHNDNRRERYPGYSGDSNSATKTSLDMPTGIAVDSSGNVYIAAFDRVLQITRTGTISTMAGRGLAGYPIDGIDARKALMEPIDVALDGNGGVYLSDANSNKVRRVGRATFLISRASQETAPWDFQPTWASPRAPS
jgi:DNA-binding beta-propeller fold protein YncE